MLFLAVVVLGSCGDPGQLAAALRAPSYLDHAIAMLAPGAQERSSMLASHLSARGAKADAADLLVLCPSLPTPAMPPSLPLSAPAVTLSLFVYPCPWHSAMQHVVWTISAFEWHCTQGTVIMADFMM